MSRGAELGGIIWFGDAVIVSNINDYRSRTREVVDCVFRLIGVGQMAFDLSGGVSSLTTKSIEKMFLVIRKHQVICDVIDTIIIIVVIITIVWCGLV